jgi:hypothetical protein
MILLLFVRGWQEPTLMRATRSMGCQAVFAAAVWRSCTDARCIKQKPDAFGFTAASCRSLSLCWEWLNNDTVPGTANEISRSFAASKIMEDYGVQRPA